MDIFKDKGSHTQGGTKHINKPTTNKERTQRKHFAPFLFLHIYRKGKGNNDKSHKDTKTDKTRQEDSQKTTRTKQTR